MSAAENPPSRRWLLGTRIGFLVFGRTSHTSSPTCTTDFPASDGFRNRMRDLSRPFASTANIPVNGSASGFVVVTRSERTTSGQASFTCSARRSSAAGSSARDAEAKTRGRKRILLRKIRGSPLNMPESLHRVQPRRAACGPPCGNEKRKRHHHEPESVREWNEVHVQEVLVRAARWRRQHDARRVQPYAEEQRHDRADERAAEAEEHALEEEERPDLPTFHADREERSDLARPFEHRHRHCV